MSTGVVTVAVLAVSVTALAVIAGTWLGRRLIDYIGWARRQKPQQERRRAEGLCPRCGGQPQPGSAYCSPRHEIDDEWTAAGY